MRNAEYNITKSKAYEVCKNALVEFGCDIVSSDLNLGIIHATKEGNLLSYGNDLTIQLKSVGNNKQEILVTSKSIGIQIIDWGANAVNEQKLIDIIEKTLR